MSEKNISKKGAPKKKAEACADDQNRNLAFGFVISALEPGPAGGTENPAESTEKEDQKTAEVDGSNVGQHGSAEAPTTKAQIMAGSRCTCADIRLRWSH